MQNKPKTTAPKIAFWGTPDFAVWVLDALLEKGVKPDLVITAPDAPKGRKLIMTPCPAKVWAQAHGIETIEPTEIKSPAFAEKLASLAPDAANGGWDLFIVAAYGKIMPENILYIPKQKTINVHPSLLPLLRGASPLQSAILANMRDTGVSIMRLDKEMDHGPILVQKKATLDTWPVDTNTLGRALARDGGHAIVDILPQLLAGKMPEQEQDHSKATYTKKIAKTDGEIDLSADGYTNFLKFNTYREWPTSFFFVEKDGKKTRVTITDAAYEDGAFIIKKVIPEGKKEMDWKAFSANR